MGDLGAAAAQAVMLVVGLDPGLLAIVRLSLAISLAATVIGAALAVPAGYALAAAPFRGRGAVVVVLNALQGLPPVVVGLVVYLLLTRQGPLGALGLLFTPGAMVLAQTVLVVPVMAAFSHRIFEGLWSELGDALRVDGASRTRGLPLLLGAARGALATALLAGFGRAVSEVGAIMLVGGNIHDYTRTMTTAIALETSKGDLPLALGLGMVLVSITIAVSAAAIALNRRPGFSLAGGP